ncbi:MAG TPA: tyrosine recombinase XerC [Polyangiaceae bacterium]|nr:tyrosine recombinase XerC [Polyangiaceae bacterium]
MAHRPRSCEGIDVTLDESRRAFARHLECERHASPRTVAEYGRDLMGFARFVRERDAERLDDVRALDVHLLRAWLALLSRTHVPSSISRKIAAIRTWMRWLRRRGVITGCPADELAVPRVRRGLPTLVSAEAAKQIVEASTGDTPLQLRNRALLEVLYGSGLRASEVCALEVHDLDLPSAVVRVSGKGRKERVVPLGQPCVRALGRWLTVRESMLRPVRSSANRGALFLTVRGGRLHRRALWAVVKEFGASGAGRADLHPHALRHSCATHMLEGGADLRAIQELLGHASLSTTQRYTHVSMDRLLRIYDAAHPLARLKQ